MPGWHACCCWRSCRTRGGEPLAGSRSKGRTSLGLVPPSTPPAARLYCHLRLARLLGALPPADLLSPEDKSCTAASLTVEQNNTQRASEADNLVGWRRSDPDLLRRFREYAVVEDEDGGWVMGRHCCVCRADRHVWPRACALGGARAPAGTPCALRRFMLLLRVSFGCSMRGSDA